MTKKQHIEYKNTSNFLPNRVSRWTSGIIAVFICCTLACKNRDNSDPKLTITNPADEITFMAGSDVLIEGTASDKQGLASLSFSLTDPNGLSTQNQENTLSGTEMDFSFVFTDVGDLQSETGSYSIKATARDINGNFTSQIIPVQLNEIPQKHYKTLIGVIDGIGAQQLYLRDTLDNLTSEMSLGAHLSCFQMDNYQQQFMTATEFSGVFTGYHPDDFFQNWVNNSPTGGGQSTYTDLYRTNTDYYVGLGLQPFVEIYGVNGNLTTAFSNLVNPVNAIFYRSNRIFTGESSANGQVKRLAAYSATTQDLVLLNPLGWDVIDILPLNEVELLVIGNDALMGHIYVINQSTLNVTEDYDFNGFVTAATIGEDFAYIASSRGVRALDCNNYTLSSIYSGDYSSIAYEPVENRVYIGKINEVRVITPSGTLIETITGMVGDVNFIDFHRNK